MIEGLEAGLSALATTRSRREKAARHGRPNDSVTVEAEEGFARARRNDDAAPSPSA